MKKNLILAICAAAVTSAAVAHALDNRSFTNNSTNCDSKVTVSWQTLGNRLNEQGKHRFLQRFVISGDVARLNKLAFNKFDCRMWSLDSLDTVVRVIPGYFYIKSPRFATAGDSLVIDLMTTGAIRSCSYGTVDAHGVDSNGKSFPVTFVRKRLTDFPEQYIYSGVDNNPSADSIYRLNQSLSKAAQVQAYDIVPSFKKLKLTGKGTYRNNGNVQTKIIKHNNKDFYRLKVEPSKVVVEAASQEALNMGRRILARLLKLNNGVLPTAVAEACPDAGYRGLMLDIARNYHPFDRFLRLIDVMADYGFNRLQFHFADDEAWRLEIPGLPELTDYAARRGFTEDEENFLSQIYFGDGNPDSRQTTANGYFTRDEFIRLLQHADSLGIAVIPEIETPGHARAAVKAMEARYRHSGDASLRMREDGDTSTYSSAQDFHDNVINPALPGGYKFMSMVFDALQDMYREAGVPLTAVHIGGDEVPRGAWSGSPSAVKFMHDNNLSGESDLHAYWVTRMVEDLAKRGIKTAGWQEVVLGKDTDFAKKMAPDIAFINIWQPWRDKQGVLPAVKAQMLNIPVLNSTCSGYYLDMAYSGHPDEPGFNWAGVTDEFRTLNTDPHRDAPKAGGDVIGVQGQLWAETINSPERRESYLLPKMLGVAERAWNADTTYSVPAFNRVVERELGYIADNGYNIHVRQPGIVLTDGRVMMNSPYLDAQIRYTLDDSEPNEASSLYTAPFALPDGVTSIRAKLFFNKKQSCTTLLRTLQTK